MGGELKDEMPIHLVRITKSFYMGIYEVTQGEYISVMGKKPANFSNTNLPVAITWNEAVEFCNRLSELTGEIYRLPTEAEWEYAARGKIERAKYVWGNSPIPEIQGKKYANVPDESLHKKHPGYKYLKNYDDGYAELSPVGSFEPNGFGLFDMCGNAWERCSDWYQVDSSPDSLLIDPQGPISGTRRVLRGGGHAFGHSEKMRVAYRCGSPTDRAGSNDGFRIVREVIN